MVVHRFQIRFDGFTVIPENIKPVFVGTKDGMHVDMWAIVDGPDCRPGRRFGVIGTGHQIPPQEKAEYFGTVICANGGLVWHVFEIMS